MLQEGLTPLMWAAWQQHEAVVQNLLEHGAIPQLKDRASLHRFYNGN
jgi:ankyrin repeat protein